MMPASPGSAMTPLADERAVSVPPTVSERRALTPRQVQALAVLADGATYRVGAERLGISQRTLKEHLSAAYERVGVTSLVGAYHEIGWLQIVIGPRTGALMVGSRG